MLADLWFAAELDTWSVVMAVLIGTGCGLLGTVFLLRRAALLGDAVSHSVLPGIAVGLIAAHVGRGSAEGAEIGVNFTTVFILGGALVAGVLSTGIIELLARHTRIKPDAALGAVFPAFFAAGVILIDVFGRGSHLDTRCVFLGALENIGSFEQVAPTLVTTLAVLVFFALASKEVLATSFDPGFARSIGLPTRGVSIALVILLAAVVVTAFEAVGAVLVIAFLIVPPATATLLSDRFTRVFLLAAVFGVSAGVLGCWITVVLDHFGIQSSRAPTMALTAGAQFAVAFLFAPRRGALARVRHFSRLRRRILDENFLGAVYRLSTRGSDGNFQPVIAERVADSLHEELSRLRPAIVRECRRGGVVAGHDGTVILTDEGELRIRNVLRAHRLWESYLAREMGAPSDHVHEAADEVEHFLHPQLLEELDRHLEQPETDPHGRKIPPGK